MTKVAVIVFADTETHADLARVVNALITVQECKEGGDDVRLLFDGAGTKWVAELANPGHRSHRLYDSVKDRITGACSFCATAFGVKAAVQAAGVPPPRRVRASSQRAEPDLRRLPRSDLLMRELRPRGTRLASRCIQT